MFSNLQSLSKALRCFINRPNSSRIQGRATAAILASVGALVLATAPGCTRKVDDTDTTINAVLRQNVKGLDPLRANDLYSSTVIAQIYEGLLQYHYLKRPHVLEPALAESMPTVSDNGLTHTFKIKKGVRFHDNPAFPEGKGREVTAEDFVYSFKRLADPRNASEGFWIFDEKIKGLNQWVEAVKAGTADDSTPVEGLQAPDKHTLVIKLTQPYYQLYYVLAMQFAGVVPREAVEKHGEEFLNNPVGTGPFMLEKPSDWVRNSKITLKRNPNWRGESYPSEGEAGDRENGLLADAGKPIPFAQQLVFTELPEDQPRWQNFMKGNFDLSEIPNDNFESTIKDNKIVPALAQKGLRLDITPNMDTTYVGINMRDPLLGKNKDLRQAMMMANDSATLAAKFYNGRAIVAQSPIPPGIDSYEAVFKNPYQFNVEKAKAALAKAGYPEGKGLPELTYEGLADSKQRQMAEFFVQNMAAIGVRVRINANAWPQFQEKIKKGEAQIFGIAWGADYPDAQNFYQLFYSKNVSPGPNDTFFANAEFDKLYEQALNMAPGSARDAVYKKMRDIVNEEVPWILNNHRLGYWTTHGWLHNYKRSDIMNTYFKFLRVDPKQRAELKPKL
jgi:oligopeptide transport system substrate-binding protein